MSKETPEERKARIAAWHEENTRKREQKANERRAEKQKHRESYDRRSESGIGCAPFPVDEHVDAAPLVQVDVVESDNATVSDKEKLVRWYKRVIQDENISAKDRLTAANQLQRLQGWEKQEVKVEIDAVTRFFQEQKPQIEAQPLPWAKKNGGGSRA